jgi:hypothetical protein
VDAIVAEADAQYRQAMIHITGEVNTAHRQALAAALGARMRFAEPLAAPDRALGVAALAQARLARGEIDSPLALEPAYIRRPNITTSARHPLPGDVAGTGH